MKIRKGFVSNSSSSSFICDVCGTAESGRDYSLEDAGMYECENGHIFCDTHILNIDDDLEDNYEIPMKYCPICQLEKLDDNTIISYLIKRSGFKEKEEILSEIRDSFDNILELRNPEKLKTHFRKLKLKEIK
jgi:hypothetical protein